MRLFNLFQKKREKGVIDNDVKDGKLPDSGSRVVCGTVYYTDWLPASGIKVVAYRKGLRSEHFLGEAFTGQGGSYSITYETDQAGGTLDQMINLMVKGFNEEDILLAESPVCYNAPANAEVNFTLATERVRVMSLFERISRAISPLLEGLTPDELEENDEYSDLTIIESTTGFSKEVTARFVISHKLSSYGMEPEFWFALLGGSFFEHIGNKSLAEHLPEINRKIASTDSDTLRENLIRAFYQDDIPAHMQDKVEEWIKRFNQLQG